MENTELNSTSPKPSTRKRWFRFSISTLLLVSVIVALGVSHWAQARTYGKHLLEMQSKLDQIREDHDLIQVWESDLIHVLPLPASSHRLGHARVYLPEGDRYLLKFEWLNKIRDESSRQVYPGRELSPGHYRIDYAIQYEPSTESGCWSVYLSAVSRDQKEIIDYPLPYDPPYWLEAKRTENNCYQLPTAEDGSPGIRIQFFDLYPMEHGDNIWGSLNEKATIVRYSTVDADVFSSRGGPEIPFVDEVFHIWIERAPKTP